MNIGDVFLRLLVDDKKFAADVAKAGDKAGQSLAGRLKSALSPARIGAALGAAFGAVAVAAAKLGGQVDAAFDTIRTGTGATGEALKGLEGDFKAVAGSVRDDLGTVGQVIADLNTRTGQTGEGLRTLAKDILDLSRITKTDAVSNVAAATRVFGDWSIATEDQTGALDKLFRTSQATGIGVTGLMETVVQFGAPMRLLGFSFEESIALLGKWEKEGVNTETAMAGLKFSVKTLAKEGVKAADMGEAFRRKLDAIKKSADPVGESIKLFGLRAGPDLAAAIIEGRFATEDLLAIIGDTDETIATATAATEDFGDALAKAFNAAKVQFGDAFSFLGSIGQTLGPLLYILPGITAAFGKLAGSIVGKAGPALAGFFQDISLGKQTGLAGAINRSGAVLGGLFAKAFAGAQIIGGAIASTLMKIPGMGAVRGAAVAAGSKLGGFMGSTLGKFAAVAFAAVAVVAMVETYNRIKGELGGQSEQIGADIAKQIAKGTTTQLEQSRAAVKAGLEKLEGVWDAGIFTGDTRKSLEAQMAALDAELARRAAGIPPTVGDALADGEGAVTAGGEEMLDGLDETLDDAAAEAKLSAREIVEGIAEGFTDRRTRVEQAIDAMTQAIDEGLTEAEEIARFRKIGSQIIDDLESDIPEVRARALDVAIAVDEGLMSLGEAPFDWGESIPADVVEGMHSGRGGLTDEAEFAADLIDAGFATADGVGAGEDVVEGIAEGMENKESVIGDAARKLAKRLLDTWVTYLESNAGRREKQDSPPPLPKPGSFPTTTTSTPRGALSTFAEGGFLPTGGTGWVGESGIEQIKSIPGGTLITPTQDGGSPVTNLNLTFTGRIGDEKEDVVSALQRAASFSRG